MSPGFKLKYDQMQQAAPARNETEAGGEAKAYAAAYGSDSHTRNLCFAWLDGNRIFLNYSYLISGEYTPQANSIILTFTSHVFVLKGVNLEDLFYDIMHQVTKQIVCTDVRYNIVGEDHLPLVNEMTMTKNEG